MVRKKFLLKQYEINLSLLSSIFSSSSCINDFNLSSLGSPRTPEILSVPAGVNSNWTVIKSEMNRLVRSMIFICSGPRFRGTADKS